jgi:hypothetical protein
VIICIDPWLSSRHNNVTGHLAASSLSASIDYDEFENMTSVRALEDVVPTISRLSELARLASALKPRKQRWNPPDWKAETPRLALFLLKSFKIATKHYVQKRKYLRFFGASVGQCVRHIFIFPKLMCR